AKPRFKRMLAAWRKENPDIWIKMHSCGDYSPILPDLIELGFDLSGLMQPTGGLKDQPAIKAKYGKDIALIGGLDVQRLLPRGQVEDVRKGVHDVMKNLAVGGGYIFSPSHYIMADVPSRASSACSPPGARRIRTSGSRCIPAATTRPS
ncbi:uroporphyrinogen decarboxylase family protein, partial [Streptococcus pneumoniae]|uniref:uroporphyrinogen decarboxylase family protein n=1 Tax=Streptococcus pneumoniae TaxID=1313 RepID=UPI001254A929